MNIKLESIKFLSRGSEGFISEKLIFGEQVTFVSGENTSGKTPIITGIVYCLGLNVPLPSDITNNCSAVQLNLQIKGNKFVFTRNIDENNQSITVEDVQQKKKTNYKVEKDFSKFLFSLLEFPETLLVNNQGNMQPLYFSFIAPLFWKEQMNSWGKIYSSLFTIIKNTREEATRFLLSIPPKLSYESKQTTKQKKIRLKNLNELIVNKNNLIDELKKNADISSDFDIKKITADRDAIRQKLSELENDFNSYHSATEAYDENIKIIGDSLKGKQIALSDYAIILATYRKSIDEVEAEIETLSLNDDAAHRFRELKSICDNENCCLFIAPKESYGKTLLYLKDQIKDLLSNEKDINLKCDILNSNILELRNEIDVLKIKKRESINKSGAENLAESLTVYSKMLSSIEMKLGSYQQIEIHNQQLHNLLLERDEVNVFLSENKQNRSNRSTLNEDDVRTGFETKFKDWVKVLNGSTKEHAIQLDNTFNPMIDGKKYSDFSGSFLTRIILAYHAALFEYCLENNLNHPRILILDTPKQQELDPESLNSYLGKLKETCKKFKNSQVIFSSSEFDYALDSLDTAWKPSFKSEKGKLMYFGHEHS